MIVVVAVCLQGCKGSKKSDLVLEDFGCILKCGTEYSGFKAVGLQKRSLKLATSKYKIKGKQTYPQTGSQRKKVRHRPCV